MSHPPADFGLLSSMKCPISAKSQPPQRSNSRRLTYRWWDGVFQFLDTDELFKVCATSHEVRSSVYFGGCGVHTLHVTGRMTENHRCGYLTHLAAQDGRLPSLRRLICRHANTSPWFHALGEARLRNLESMELCLLRPEDLGCNTKSSSGDELLGWLSQMHKLSEISLIRIHSVSDEHLYAIATSCPELRVFRLEAPSGGRPCRASDRGVRRLTQCAKQLREVSLVGVTELTDASLEAVSIISDLQQLQIIGLRGTTDRGRLAIAENAYSLKRLTMDRVGDDALRVIASRFDQLESLELPSISVQEDGLYSIARGIPKLKEINLADNVSRVPGVTDLLVGPHLISLWLPPSTAATSIVDCAPQLPSLTLLHKKRDWSDEAVRALASYCPKLATLEALDICGSSPPTEASLDALLTCRRLKSLKLVPLNSDAPLICLQAAISSLVVELPALSKLRIEFTASSGMPDVRRSDNVRLVFGLPLAWAERSKLRDALKEPELAHIFSGLASKNSNCRRALNTLQRALGPNLKSCRLPRVALLPDLNILSHVAVGAASVVMGLVPTTTVTNQGNQSNQEQQPHPANAGEQ